MGAHPLVGGAYTAWLSVVDDWYEPGSRERRGAWVVQWVEDNDGRPTMHRALVELIDGPIERAVPTASLHEKAEAVVLRGTPIDPAGFGFAPTGLNSRGELAERMKLAVYAVDTATGRVAEAALRQVDFAASILGVAITEMLAWLRGLDELIAYVWEMGLTDAVRERASRDTDESAARVASLPVDVSEAVTLRAGTGKPYADWTLVLLPTGQYVPRVELVGMRWLAGKLLHYGPLPVAELRHWRAGEEPRWKWRSADAIFPATEDEERPKQRALYDRHLSGRDILGTILMSDVLIEIEYLFGRLLRESDEEEDSATSP